MEVFEKADSPVEVSFELPVKVFVQLRPRKSPPVRAAKVGQPLPPEWYGCLLAYRDAADIQEIELDRVVTVQARATPSKDYADLQLLSARFHTSRGVVTLGGALRNRFSP
jgi:hypothetical protein